MDKNKVSYYASLVVLGCGLLIVLLQFLTGLGVNSKTYFGLVFVILGFLGVRFFRNKA